MDTAVSKMNRGTIARRFLTRNRIDRADRQSTLMDARMTHTVWIRVDTSKEIGDNETDPLHSRRRL
jgi:hypothetical protein